MVNGLNDRENILTLLVIANEKVRHLDVISNNLFGFMIVSTAAIWGFYFSQNFDSLNLGQFLVLLGMTSALLGLWRWTHHEYDNEIVRLYPEIIKYERLMGLSESEGLTGLLNRTTNIAIKSYEPINQSVERVWFRVKQYKIGERGRFRFTKIVFCFIAFSSLISIGYLILNYTSVVDYLVKDNFANIWMILFGIPYIIAWSEIYHCYKIAQKNYDMRGKNKWLRGKFLGFLMNMKHMGKIEPRYYWCSVLVGISSGLISGIAVWGLNFYCIPPSPFYFVIAMIAIIILILIGFYFMLKPD